MEFSPKRTISEEEVDEAFSNKKDLSVERDILVEFVNVRHSLFTAEDDVEKLGKWRVPEAEAVLILNVGIRVANGATGNNPAGKRADLPPIKVTLDGNGAVSENDAYAEDNRKATGRLLRTLMPFYGGKDKKNPGAYPKDEEGYADPVTLLMTEGENLQGLQALCDVKVNDAGYTNYYFKPTS